MKLTAFILLIGFLISGCHSEPATQDAAPKSEATSTGSSVEPASDAATEIKVGMSMTDVKKIKGAPKDTKHDHGPNDSELDFWVYDDQTVKFQDGKVVE